MLHSRRKQSHDSNLSVIPSIVPVSVHRWILSFKLKYFDLQIERQEIKSKIGNLKHGSIVRKSFHPIYDSAAK